MGGWNPECAVVSEVKAGVNVFRSRLNREMNLRCSSISSFLGTFYSLAEWTSNDEARSQITHRPPFKDPHGVSQLSVEEFKKPFGNLWTEQVLRHQPRLGENVRWIESAILGPTAHQHSLGHSPQTFSNFLFRHWNGKMCMRGTQSHKILKIFRAKFYQNHIHFHIVSL